MSVGPSGWLFLLFATLYLPIASIRRAKKAREDIHKTPRRKLVQAIVVSHAFLGLISVMVCWAEEANLFPPPTFTGVGLLLAFGVLVVWLGTLPLRWNSRTAEQKTKIMRRMPNRSSDLWGWGLVALSAGVFEEIFFRGAMYQLWFRALGGFWPAALACSVAFSVVHIYQGWKSVAIIFPMAIAIHLIVRETGDLYTAMALHFVYDFLAGVTFWQLAKCEGLLPLPELGTSDEASAPPVQESDLL